MSAPFRKCHETRPTLSVFAFYNFVIMAYSVNMNVAYNDSLLILIMILKSCMDYCQLSIVTSITFQLHSVISVEQEF